MIDSITTQTNAKTPINNETFSSNNQKQPNALQSSLINQIVKITLLHSNNVDHKIRDYEKQLKGHVNTKKELVANGKMSVEVDAHIQDLLNKISDLERNRNTIFEYTKKMIDQTFKLIEKINERMNQR